MRRKGGATQGSDRAPISMIYSVWSDVQTAYLHYYITQTPSLTNPLMYYIPCDSLIYGPVTNPKLLHKKVFKCIDKYISKINKSLVLHQDPNSRIYTWADVDFSYYDMETMFIWHNTFYEVQDLLLPTEIFLWLRQVNRKINSPLKD